MRGFLNRLQNPDATERVPPRQNPDATERVSPRMAKTPWIARTSERSSVLGGTGSVPSVAAKVLQVPFLFFSVVCGGLANAADALVPVYVESAFPAATRAAEAARLREALVRERTRAQGVNRRLDAAFGAMPATSG